MNELIIRAGTREDIEQISRLWLQMIDEANLGNTPNVEWWKNMFNNLIGMKDLYFILVAEFQGKIVGFIDAMFYPEPQDGKIHGMAQGFFILPEYRGTKAGPELYRHIYKIGHRMKVQVATFFCSDPDYWIKKGYVEQKALLRRNICQL